MIRNAVFFFAVLALFAVAGFWPSYIARISAEKSVHVHLHGVVMALWLVLLISQAFLIRSDRRAFHRQLGKASFVLVPLIVLATLSLGHLRVRQAGNELTAEPLYFLYVQLSLLAIFVLAYSLAIVNRRSPQIHARYIACTALTLIDPIFGRLLYFNLGIEFPLMPMLTNSLVVVILLCLIAWDRRQRRPSTVYPAMLGVFVITQVPAYFIYRLPEWRTFAQWFGSLPLP